METPVKSLRSTPLTTPSTQTPNRLGALSPSANSTPGRNSALSLRVSKILSSSYKDEETCNALGQLAQFDLTDLADEYKSRSAGTGVAGGATAGVNLKRQAELRMADSARSFLAAFTQVNSKLDELQSHLNGMHTCCDEVSGKLQLANSSTKHLLEHAEGLRQQKATAQIKQTVISTFLSRFSLSSSELTSLTSPSSPLGQEMFAAMDKVYRIREDCQVLLTDSSDGKEDQTKAGIQIMEATSSHLEAGYRKMHKWAVFNVRGYTRLEVEVSPIMKQVVQRLKAREDLLKEVLDQLASTRSASVLAQFLEALTRGGPSGLPRPIELHAHDPIRYVGDMLAWVHQTMAGEREFLESLFSMKEDGRLPGSVRPVYKAPVKNDLEKQEDEGRVRALMDKNLEGAGRPLKLRIQQTIRSQEGSLLAYKISNLVSFYRLTIERTIGRDALMSAVLTDIANASTEAFFSILDTNGRSLLRFIQPPPSDLSAPLMLRDALTTLKEIMEVYRGAALDEADREGGSETFEEVLERALDPALAMCDRMSELRQSQWDRDVFTANCLGYVKTTLEPYASFTATRIENVQKAEGKHAESLIAEHYQSILKESGLKPIADALEHRDDDTPLSRIPAASPTALSQSLRTFDNYLTTSVLQASPRLALLSSPRMANHIQQEALTRLSAAYGRIYDAVMSGKEGYEFSVTRMRRVKEDVATLLGVQ